MKSKFSLILYSVLFVILSGIFGSVKLNSEKIQPPPGYTGNPPAYQDCSYCHPHSGPINDSMAFGLTIGPDTSHLASFTSGVTTYTPNQVYYLRVQATHVRPVYGFELSANDTAGNSLDIGSFAILDSTNTSLSTIDGYGTYVGHRNANQNNQWTFTWTAPAAYFGPITFYWAGNDANGDDAVPPNGDTIYLAQKTITASPGASVNEISNDLTDLRIFPTVCSGNFQLEFNVVSNSNVTGKLLNMKGEVLWQMMDETLSPGSYSRNVSLDGQASGIYLVKIQTGTACFVKKIIKQ
jgi:hypothetical protein